MRSNTMSNTKNPTASAFAAPAAFDAAQNMISIRTLNVLLGVLLLHVIRISLGLLIPPQMSLNRV